MDTIEISKIVIPAHQRELRLHRVIHLSEKMRQDGYNESYPITLEPDGETLIDGGHRIAAAELARMTAVPFVISERPPIAHAVRCNRDGAFTLEHDVFDLANLCYGLTSDGWTGQQVAEELGWSDSLVGNYKSIKDKLHPLAWNLCRYDPTKKQDFVNADNDNVVESYSTIVEWRESHLRAILKYIPCNDHNDPVVRLAQIRTVQDILARFADPKKSVTAKSIVPIAKRHAWHAELVQYVLDKLAPEVPGKDKGLLIKNVYKDVFGKEQPGGDDPLSKIAQAVSTLNEKALGVKLYHDDALQRIPLFDDASIALVATDPPYNVTDNEWDKVGTDDEYIEFMRLWLEAVRPKLADDYHLFLFCSSQYQAQIEQLLLAEGWPLETRIIWHHRNMSEGRDVEDKFISSWDMIFHCGTHALNWPAEWNEERFDVQVFATPQSNFKEGKHHPTPKPLALIEKLVSLGSKPGEIVLDMFAGGGTTGQACANIRQRRCILIEKDDEFCTIIENRLGIKRIKGVING